MRATSILVALLTAGCSIVLAPDRDAIIASMDGGYDGGYDGGFDGDVPDGGDPDAGDAGYDGGDGGCTPNEDREVTCNDGVDNDCDGNSDCDDPNCASDGYCCAPSETGTSWPGDMVRYGEWVPYGAPTVTSTSVVFGTSTGQVVHPDCAPLAYGMRFELDFTRAGMRATDFAAFVLAPVDMPRGGGDMTLLADLALRVSGDGHARLERAGTLIGESPIGMELPSGRSSARIDLTPSVDDAGRPVLLVAARIGAFVLAGAGEVLMPLDDLIGPDGSCRPDGLYVALEGEGSSVQITSPVTTGIGDCDNPTQFLSDSMGPLADADVLPPGEATGEWRAGGAGEPTLLALPVGSATTSLEVLVDASIDERSDEILRFLDFSIGGATRMSRWTHRTSGAGGPATLFGDDPSSREPAFVSGAALDPHLVAYARRRDASADVHELAWARLDPAANATPTMSQVLIQPGTNLAGGVVDCDSLRDPSVLAVPPASGSGTEDLVVFFTCERAVTPDSIGVARLARDSTGPTGYRIVDVDVDLLQRTTTDDYARRGVFSPEALITGTDAGNRTLRVWYLTRDGAGRVRVALAYGELGDGLPLVTPYPGNPILEAEAQLLGGPCPLGCVIESLGVTATEGSSTLWPPFFGREPSYIFLIERSSFRADGVDHQLVPLRQPRPSDG